MNESDFVSQEGYGGRGIYMLESKLDRIESRGDNNRHHSYPS